ncbi:MAG TPA: helix-turn-helix domain-containing protein [Candidatus Cloacimonadota bacterium]|nr:AraC family transcriptional regulator [Candidatus Cloacimonadota bacterium]HOD53176.1 helix-turn-helix domain-containing protein [Candidatus Cloacimonadota bacterium]HPM01009.1 helix-turn-helix domain-containing protein [Candidatus Cloacimonadota bacterium]
MRCWVLKPCKELSSYIKHYWVLEIDEKEGDITERVIPTGNIELMFHYKKPFTAFTNHQVINQPKSFLSGIAHQYSDVLAKGGTGVIAVTFFPYGACHFFDFPLSEADNRIISLSDIDYKSICEIEERLYNTPEMIEKIKIIEGFLIKRFRTINTHDVSFIKESIQLIRYQKGLIKVSDLSRKLHTTTRTMERKFNHFLGKSPKQYIRIIRFHRVVKGLYQLQQKSLTEYAYENEYFDQAHFINDFKQLTGYSPSEFIANCPEEPEL